MIKKSRLIGPYLRQLRQRLGLTQKRMAAELDISASYLTLIENNQRPLSGKLQLRLLAVYNVDLSDFTHANARISGEIVDALQMPELRGSLPALDQETITRFVGDHPDIADALLELTARLRDSYQTTAHFKQHLVDRHQAALHDEDTNALERLRRFVHDSKNYFPYLDETAEDLANSLQLDASNRYRVLTAHLQHAHNLETHILPSHVMGEVLRHYDRHNRRFLLCELLSASGRLFHLAYQIAMLEHREDMNAIMDAAHITGKTTRSLTRITLANYFAAALLMPYGQFLKDAVQSRYDLELLSHRYGTSFEQVAHRVTTLQRPNATGIPFFFVRVDSAGNVTKRFTSGSFHFSKLGGGCPLWTIHECFTQPGRIISQKVTLPDESTYFTISRTVRRAGGTREHPAQIMAIGLGCDLKYANRIAYADAFRHDSPATHIGVNCYICPRINCVQRAFAPLDKKLSANERVRRATPYHFTVEK